MIKKELKRLYKMYAAALKSGNIDEAIHRARTYNHFLRAAGGPTNVSGEFYLTLGLEARKAV
jgi:hypothetical protein